ncbi:MAG TPA: diguanylate cyclase, partial [Gemmatimonadales bacterium]
AEQLESASTQASRELDLWIKEREYDIRVFASSYEVSENVLTGSRGAAHTRLTEYLNSVRRRFGGYTSIVVMNREGDPVASSAGATPAPLSPQLLREVRTHDAVLGDPYADPSDTVVLTITVPISATSGSGAAVGAMSATLHLSIDEILRSFARTGLGEVLVVERDGTVIASSRPLGKPLQVRLPEAALAALRNATEGTAEYVDYRNVSQVGIVKPIVRSTWSVVAQVPRERAFAEIVRLRNTTVVTLLILLGVVGVAAYWLGGLIHRPLALLTRGVRQVAGGNFDVDIPVHEGEAEVAYLTQVFNEMVKAVRDGRSKLEHLSITDGLTGLANRRHLMELLDQEVKRLDRTKSPCTLLMIDVDHFKKFNDSYGHQAGDAALARVGKVLKECTRDVDRAGRYGGEEFAVLLPETDLAKALVVAERIRERMEAESLTVKGGTANATLSIGVAECPSHGETTADLMAAADAALYEAKRKGRNRVAQGKRGSRKMPAL